MPITRFLAVVANNKEISLVASSKDLKTFILFSTSPAPAEMAYAELFGQPSLGSINLSFSIPKFFIARAVEPIFSPSCGLDKIILGVKSII